MPKSIVEEGSEYYLEEGESTVRLRNVEEKTTSFTYRSHHKAVKNGEAKAGDTGTFTQWVWSVEFVDGPNKGKKTEIQTQPKVELKGYSVARDMYQAFSGQSIELGQEIDTDFITGLSAIATVENFEEADKLDPNRIWYRSRLVDWRPAEGGNQDPWSGPGGLTNDEIPF